MSKKIGIMQPYFFPYIGYWQLIKAVDCYVVYDDVNYILSGWINRNNILLNGQKHLVTIPLQKASFEKHINEIDITDNTIAKKKILKTIEMAYKKAPYYDGVFQIISNMILSNELNLAKLLFNSINTVCDYLKINTNIVLSSQIEKNCALKAQSKVIDIIKTQEGTKYLNAIGGQSLYSKDEFQKNNIQLNFLQTNFQKYKQFHNEFIPGLSIIDVMMFNSPERINEMLDDYELL